MLTNQQCKDFQDAVYAICRIHTPVRNVGWAQAVGMLKAHLEMVASGRETAEQAVERIIQRGKELTS